MGGSIAAGHSLLRRLVGGDGRLTKEDLNRFEQGGLDLIHRASAPWRAAGDAVAGRINDVETHRYRKRNMSGSP